MGVGPGRVGTGRCRAGCTEWRWTEQGVLLEGCRLAPAQPAQGQGQPTACCCSRRRRRCCCSRRCRRRRIRRCSPDCRCIAGSRSLWLTAHHRYSGPTRARRSTAPTAFCGYSFHPAEALLVFANEVLVCYLLPIHLGLHRAYHLFTTIIHEGAMAPLPPPPLRIRLVACTRNRGFIPRACARQQAPASHELPGELRP